MLTGRYNGSYGSQPVTGTVRGTDIEFSFLIEDKTRVTYWGTVEERTVKGTCDYAEASGKGTSAARRANSPWNF